MSVPASLCGQPQACPVCQTATIVPVELAKEPDMTSEYRHNLVLDLGEGTEMKLVWIPAGEFIMGWSGPEEDHNPHANECPPRRVTISKPFYMGVTQVTLGQWAAIVDTWRGIGEDYTNPRVDHAASYLTWDDVTKFCRMVSEKVGRKVRLPTEAQWEYACRAGTTTLYGFGDDDSLLSDYAWWHGNTFDKKEAYPHPVGIKKPNAWGLYDMHGNVMEWCADWFGSYANAAVRDPQGPPTGEYRILRGGAWTEDPFDNHAAFRCIGRVNAANHATGFRVVAEVEQPQQTNHERPSTGSGESPNCPHCGFSYKFNGTTCGHCGFGRR